MKVDDSGLLQYYKALAYSPDFNPIENMWSKIKQVLRSIASRTTMPIPYFSGRVYSWISPFFLLASRQRIPGRGNRIRTRGFLRASRAFLPRESAP